ncbi:MAG: tRNA (guanosine(46)-N7)-methyltransferase TrmB [Clostridia bacterium]|nr:tRNA (guanosine(46)-N7)-methyltransferase TrmB [Clostridia bacterium]
MRQRRLKNLDEKMEEMRQILPDNFIDNELMESGQLQGKWAQSFKEAGKPLFLEIGCGKGKFIVESAQKHPENNYLAIEGQASVLHYALRKIKDKPLANLKFISKYLLQDQLLSFFAKEELDGIYLNFSDPWPKARHAKRRLTYHKNLLIYRELIKKGGFIQFKSDNDGLFDFTLEELKLIEEEFAKDGKENPFEILKVERDLHNSELAVDNIMTEYETKFSERGKNINYLLVKIR